MTNFEAKWKKVLSRIDAEKYRSQQFNDNSWKNLPTRDLPKEAQRDINKHSKRLASHSVLVINHPYCGYIDLDGSGSPLETKPEKRNAYLNNLERLLQEKDSSKINTVFFDYPELYVFDSRPRLLKGQIKSVILTDIDNGGSLFFGTAHKEIGEGKVVYLAGSYLPCASKTARELESEGNEIFVIEDAFHESHNDKRRVIFEEMQVAGLGFVTTQAFLESYGMNYQGDKTTKRLKTPKITEK